MYLYLLDVSLKKKEIIITISERLLWNLIPFNIQAFKEILKIFPDYEIYELDEKFLRDR